jgi:hypothetical protein
VQTIVAQLKSLATNTTISACLKLKTPNNKDCTTYKQLKMMKKIQHFSKETFWKVSHRGPRRWTG